MFGFGKSSKKKKGKGKKNKKSGGANDDDYFRPQPVSLQRGWATGSKGKKAAPPKKSHKSQRSNSNSSNKKQSPLPVPDANPEAPEVQSQPQPQPQPQPASHPPPQHAQSVKNINASSSNSKPVASSGLQHAQTSNNLNPSRSFSHRQPQSAQAPLYEHKTVDSNTSVGTALSTQSAPYNNNYGLYNKPPSHPPPTTNGRPPNAYNAPQRNGPTHHTVPSEGIRRPQTGQPEVVGDISSWRAQQQQRPAPPQQAAYPHLNPHHANVLTPDGVPSTGGGYNPHLEQSRTSATGQNGFSGINQVQQDPYYQANANNARLKSAADEPDTIIASSIIAYNPNVPQASVPEESSSSDDDDLNALMSGDAFKVAAAQDSNEAAQDAKMKQEAKPAPVAQKPKPKQPVDLDAVLNNGTEDKEKAQKKEKVDMKEAEAPPSQARAAKEEEKAVKEEAKEDDMAESSSEEDDGGLSDWLLSIGFKKKKLALMLHALSELGLDSMDDLETLLLDLYRNSFGNQQKQWMDKIQHDILDQGIKYAQWIRFSTKAQQMIEMKAKQKKQEKRKKEQELRQKNNAQNVEDPNFQPHHRKAANTIDTRVESKIQNINGVTTENKSGFIVMQSEEAGAIENLRIAMSVIYSGIDSMDKVVLEVESNEKRALDSVQREFGNLQKQIEIRKNLLIDSITRVGEDKASILGKQNTNLRSIAAEYEDTMHSFNNILASNQNLRSKMEIGKRAKTLTTLVNTVLNRNRDVEMTPGCTPLIGFQCNMTPVVLELNRVGVVTWGNAPDPSYITRITTTDWSITIQYENRSQQNNASDQKATLVNVAQDPIIAYEIQCVLCENEENLLWNFKHAAASSSGNKQLKKSNKHHRKHAQASLGIITKHVTSKKIVLVGFVSDNRSYVVRVRCQNRNGWSEYSRCSVCHTKKKKKRKTKVMNEKLRIIRHRGSAQDGSPNNLLFSNEKSIYKSLSNQDFINEYNGWKRMNAAMNVNKQVKSKEFNDWIIFDLGAFIELVTFRIKFDVHYRWGNVPKLIYLDIADYDDASYSQSIIAKYKPISYDDDYNNNASNMSGVLVQLRQKRVEQQNLFESIWNRLTIVECKKKSGWQDFHLAEYIDEAKRKGQYIRMQFVNNFDCTIEHYSKFVVEQIAFIGIQYDD